MGNLSNQMASEGNGVFENAIFASLSAAPTKPTLKLDPLQVELQCSDPTLVVAPFVEQAITLNESIYPKAPPLIRVTICCNQEEWRREASEYANLDYAWGVTLDNGGVVLRHPSLSGIDSSRFSRVVTHELSHCFWIHCFPLAGWSPIWLVEGVANVVAATRDLMPLEDVRAAARQGIFDPKMLEHQYRPFRDQSELVRCYSLWKAMVTEIEHECGIDRLMQCIDSFQRSTRPSETEFWSTFYQITGHSPTSLWLRFLANDAGTGCSE